MERSPWILIALAMLPDQLQAQVLAGDTTGLVRTVVNVSIVSPFGPGFNGDDATLYMGVTGAMDLFLFVGNIHTTWDDRAWTLVNPTPSGMEVASNQAGGFLAERLDSLDEVNASLSWVGYAELLGDPLVLASLSRDTSDPNNWIGMGQWFENEGDTTQGYMAVRFPQPTDTLYGWLRLTSCVTRDSSWLLIHDFAIEMTTINSTEGNPQFNTVSVRFGLDGGLHLEGGKIGVPLHVELRDMLGRALYSGTTYSPASLEIPLDAHGAYLICISQCGSRQSVRLFR